MKTTNTRQATGDHYAAAMTWVEDCPYDFDSDGGVRDREEWRRDVFFATVAEHVVSDWMDAIGVDHRCVPDSEDESHDILAYSDIEIEVKHRYGDLRDDPDLIATHGYDVNNDSDIYVLVESQGILADGPSEWMVVGVATGDVIDDRGRPFNWGARDKTIVDRDHLRPPRAIWDALAAVKQAQNTAS